MCIRPGRLDTTYPEMGIILKIGHTKTVGKAPLGGRGTWKDGSIDIYVQL